MIFIYTLSTQQEPDVIRYIGKTNNLKSRLRRHLSKSYLKENSYKNNWIKQQIDLGNEIIIRILDEVPDDEWQFWETYWINLFTSWGFRLTNSTEGGDGITASPQIVKKRGKTRKKNNELKNKKFYEEYQFEQVDDKWFAQRRCPNCGNEVEYSGKVKTQVARRVKRALNEGRKCSSCQNKGENNFFYGKRLQDGARKRAKYGKKIVQLDLKGKKIQEFDSIRQASEELNIDRKSISYCCRGVQNYNTAGGFKFKYKE